MLCIDCTVLHTELLRISRHSWYLRSNVASLLQADEILVQCVRMIMQQFHEDAVLTVTTIVNKADHTR